MERGSASGLLKHPFLMRIKWWSLRTWLSMKICGVIRIVYIVIVYIANSHCNKSFLT